MRARFTFNGVVSFYGSSCDVTVGQTFTVKLFGAPGPMEWQATSDEVLKIVEDDLHTTATITATGVGTSKVELEYRNREYGVLFITVISEDSPTHLKPTIGEVEQQ